MILYKSIYRCLYHQYRTHLFLTLMYVLHRQYGSMLIKISNVKYND